MTVEPIVPDDAPALLALAAEWGQRRFHWLPGSSAVVARDARGVAGFALICERPYGHVVEELWCERSRRGKRATAAIVAWMEAQERHRGGAVGGIVAETSPLYAVLRRRGYEPVAHVLAKAL